MHSRAGRCGAQPQVSTELNDAGLDAANADARMERDPRFTIELAQPVTVVCDHQVHVAPQPPKLD